MLLQSGLDEKWWAASMDCNCYLRNVQDFLADERRFGEPFRGPVILFGSMIEHHILFLRKTSQDSTNLGSKFYLESSLDVC